MTNCWTALQYLRISLARDKYKWGQYHLTPPYCYRTVSYGIVLYQAKCKRNSKVFRITMENAFKVQTYLALVLVLEVYKHIIVLRNIGNTLSFHTQLGTLRVTNLIIWVQTTFWKNVSLWILTLMGICMMLHVVCITALSVSKKLRVIRAL